VFLRGKTIEKQYEPMKKKKELVVVIMYKGKQSDERYRIDIDIETSDIGLKRPNSNVIPDINESLNEYPISDIRGISVDIKNPGQSEQDSHDRTTRTRQPEPDR
jgi:hypothetical protein